jgi:hypothetical protein
MCFYICIGSGFLPLHGIIRNYSKEKDEFFLLLTELVYGSRVAETGGGWSPNNNSWGSGNNSNSWGGVNSNSWGGGGNYSNSWTSRPPIPPKSARHHSEDNTRQANNNQQDRPKLSLDLTGGCVYGSPVVREFWIQICKD